MNIYEPMNIHDGSGAPLPNLLPLGTSMAAKSPQSYESLLTLSETQQDWQLARSLLSTLPQERESQL